MNPILARSFATLIAVGAALSAHAQPHGGWRHEHRRMPTVTLYEHADFRGASLTLEIGQRIPNLDWARFDNGSRINDRISSIRIEGPVELVAFEHAEFSGRALVTAGDIRNLDWIQGRWNDVISSLRVRPIGARDHR
jgi:hypothetical protein